MSSTAPSWISGSRGRLLARVPVFPLVAIAAAAVVLGHQMVYALAIPAARARTELLARTGHAYLPGTARLVLLAALAALGGLFLSSVTRRDVGQPTAGSIVRRLAAVQISIFVGMEIAERVAAGAPLSEMLDHGLLLFGVAAQVLLAFAGAAILTLVYRAAETAAEIAPRAVDSVRGILAVPAPIPLLVAVSHRRSAPARGPPAP